MDRSSIEVMSTRPALETYELSRLLSEPERRWSEGGAIWRSIQDKTGLSFGVALAVISRQAPSRIGGSRLCRCI